MTVQSRTTLKSYFITGASPSESDFGDLIDSTLLVGDIVDSLVSTSSVNPLSARSGKTLNDSINLLTARVDSLEEQETDFASDYYTKTEVDIKLQAVDTVINSLTYQSQINDLQDQINNIGSGGSSNASISIADVTGLQSELDTKATVAELNDVRDSLIASINAIDTGGGSVDLTGINSSISALNDEIDALESQLANKADTGHIHGNIYTKTEVDSLINNIDTSDHTHVSADITDLGTEIQQKTNLLVADHSNLTNNPHSVTKEQIGLGKVENLTPSEIISQAGGVSQDDITSIQTQLDTHVGATNPHGLQKADIGLGDVPNVNPQALLDAHLAEDNPHNIDLSFFDVYTTAESDARTIFHIDAVRYAFTPLSGSDSAGAVGDIAYDADNLYFKTGSTQWKRLEFSPVGGDGRLQIELDATQLGAGLGVDGVYTANSTTNYLRSATSLVSADEALDAQLKIVADAVASNDLDIFFIQQSIGSTESSITSLQDEINATQLSAGLGADGSYIGNTSANYISTATSLQEADDLLDAQAKTNATDIISNATDIATNATDIATNASDIADLQTKTVNISSDGSSADIKYIDAQEVEFIQNWSTKQSSEKLVYNFNTTRLNIGSAEVATLTDLAGFVTSLELQNALANLDLTGGSTDDSGESTDGGTETDLVLDGTTGGVNSGYAIDGNGGFYAIDYGGDGTLGTGDDDEVEYWALDTSSLVNTGLLINVGLGQYNPYLRYDVTLNNWQIYNGGSTNSPYEIKDSYSKTESDGKYALNTDAYTKAESDGKYALTTDITPHVDAYTKTESDDKYALLSDTYTRSVADGKYALQSRVAMNDGLGGTSIIANGLSSGTPSTTGLEVNFGTGNNPYIHFNVTAQKWYAYDGVSEVEIGAVINNTTINEGDTVTNTTVLNQTVVQQSLTIDGTSGGAQSGYAYTEYDDGSGTLVGEKYSIDYGADSTFGTADDDDSEDYWDINASSYQNAGLTVNAGLDPNPSIKYDGTNNMWLVENGEYGSTDYGSFHIKDVDAAVSALVDSAPNTLNTLNELAAALGDDPNFATSTSTALGNRVRVDVNNQNLSSTQKTNARTNIGAQVAGSYAASSHNHSATNITSGQLGIARIPTGTTSSTVCLGNDSRLSDARTPTSHNHDDRHGRYIPNVTFNDTFSGTYQTADFIDELTNDFGCFNNNDVSMKVGWSYAGNRDLNTGIGTIELAGCVIETWGQGSYKHVRITRPNTGTGGASVWEYNDQGSSYAPGWRRFWTDRDFEISDYYTKSQVDEKTSYKYWDFNDWYAAYSNTDPSTINYYPSTQLGRLYSSTDTTLGIVYKAIRVGELETFGTSNPVRTFKVAVRAYASSSDSDGFYIGLFEYDSDLPAGKQAISNNASSSDSAVVEDTRLTWLRQNGSITTSLTTYEYTFTVASTCKWFSIGFLNWSGMGTKSLYFDPSISIKPVVEPYSV